MAALTDHITTLIADLPLTRVPLVITDKDPGDSSEFRVMTGTLADEKLTEITFWVFGQAGRGLRMGDLGVEGVSFLGRLRRRLTATAEHQGIDAVIPELPQMVGEERTAGATRVLILTTFDDEYIYGALRAGASGFLVKDMALDDILGAIRVVAAGDTLIAPSVTRRLIAEFAARPEPAPQPRPAGNITEREREVLTLIGRGMSNNEIAAHLHISVATAKAHVARLLTKLEARDRVQLVITAYEIGLVTPPR
ncbi:response regulator transcription factor [Streptomyces sp. NPDC093970]|uniref:response regulator transcription factor n=1 Tax=Streptomyces sp. NPDC093970 TaxID=3155076 RepID=UPI00342D5443